jgi:Tol biopolymer transport system component
MTRILMRVTFGIMVGSACLVLLALGVGRLLNEDDIVYATYLNAYSDIYRMSPNRHLSVAMTHNISDNSDPTWSPDGQRIALISKYKGLSLVSVMDAYKGHSVTVTDAIADEYSPAWSPDGRYIAFLRLNDATTDLYVTDLQLGTTRRLTSSLHTYYPPAWSPDGRYLTFAADINAKNSTDLFKMDFQTNIITPLVESPVQETFNTWSPDGHYVLYMVKGAVEGIHLWDVRASASVFLYQSDNFSSIPNWSPDSRFIIFSAVIPNGQDGLYRLNVNDCLQTPKLCIPELVTASYGFILGPRLRPRTS